MANLAVDAASGAQQSGDADAEFVAAVEATGSPTAARNALVTKKESPRRNIRVAEIVSVT